jgi:hypothetical protein
MEVPNMKGLITLNGKEAHRARVLGPVVWTRRDAIRHYLLKDVPGGPLVPRSVNRFLMKVGMIGMTLLALAAGLIATQGTAQIDEPVPMPESEPSVRMSMKLEKTIFKFDVLTLTLWLGPDTTEKLVPFLGQLDQQAARDSVAHIAMDSRNAWARITFHREVGLDRFLAGIDDNMRRARRAGILSSSGYETISSDLPRWFAPVSERGFRSGDRLFYRIRGDTLRTVLATASGWTPIDQVDVGPERHLAVLGSFLVEGSDFRKGLLASLRGSQ